MVTQNSEMLEGNTVVSSGLGTAERHQWLLIEL